MTNYISNWPLDQAHDARAVVWKTQRTHPPAGPADDATTDRWPHQRCAWSGDAERDHTARAATALRGADGHASRRRDHEDQGSTTRLKAILGLTAATRHLAGATRCGPKCPPRGCATSASCTPVDDASQDRLAASPGTPEHRRTRHSTCERAPRPSRIRPFVGHLVAHGRCVGLDSVIDLDSAVTFNRLRGVMNWIIEELKSNKNQGIYISENARILDKALKV